MPELPEVETVSRAVEKIALGKKIINLSTSGKKLRRPIPENLELLKNQKIINFSRKGKFLAIDFENSKTLIIHLGMSGNLFIKEESSKSKHDHLILKTCSLKNIVFNDPRRFGAIKLVNTKNWLSDDILKNIGPDALESSFNAKYFYEQIKNRKTNLKSILLNQKIVAGIGNIYASEICFESKISPLKLAFKISPESCEKIVSNSKMILKKAISLGGSSLKDYANPDGTKGLFQNHFKAFNRQNLNCLNNCNSRIEKIVISGRSTFFCSTCQKNN